jgi:hypothetical protein
MDDAPTTMNGPLHAPEATTEERAISATFPGREAAEAAQRQLVAAGVAADRIALGERPVMTGRPPDDGVIGRIREAIVPEEGTNATRAAARDDDVILTLRPLREEVETAVAVLGRAGAKNFDADLERWRNRG